MSKNRNCLAIRLTNQKAAFLNEREAAEFRCKTEWVWVNNPVEPGSELSSTPNPLDKPVNKENRRIQALFDLNIDWFANNRWASNFGRN